MTDSAPIYNLKAVLQEVDLSAATLRAWESRYGLPKPQRTTGGHRLYSRQDIETLKWLIEKQKEGLSISRAVELWKSMPQGTRTTTAQVLIPAIEKLSTDGILAELRHAWVEACSNFDGRTADQVLNHAFTLTSPETICIELVMKGLAEVGDLWFTGKISVQQEHFASSIAMRRIYSLLAAVIPPSRTGRILAACPPGEQHEFSLLMVTYLLKRNGWDVVYLGANVPIDELDATIRSTQPELIISVAQTINSAASLKELSEATLFRNLPLAYGGGIFERIPALASHISGYYLGPEVGKVPQVVEKILNSPPAISVGLTVPSDHTRALERFTQDESKIASDVLSAIDGRKIDPELINIANFELGQLIHSALILGDINLLDYSSEWLNGLLASHGFSPSVLGQYYTSYQYAVEKYLGSDGAIIREFLGRQIG